MPSNRKFYKTIIHYEVMSEFPIGDANLETIAYQTNQGDWSGQFLDRQENVLGGKQAAAALLEQGSNPEFFQLDEDGNDIDE